jgi:glycosyltransferase involved in cell wall biosynthesis
MEYVKHADMVIFSMPEEREAVIARYPAAAQKSVVLPISASIPNFHSNKPELRGNGIINFGQLREGKGHRDVIELAKLIRDDRHLMAYSHSNPENAARVYVVGAPVHPEVLADLIKASYGLEDKDLPKACEDTKLYNRQLVDFLRSLQERHARGVIPLEIHLSATKDKICSLINRSQFGYLPIERGATQHSTALPALMTNDCVTITRCSEQTPESLRNGGVIFAQTPQDALREIKDRIAFPEKNMETRNKAHEYIDTICPKKTAEMHEEIYQRVLTKPGKHLPHGIRNAHYALQSSESRTR